jgi:hypothetical protein
MGTPENNALRAWHFKQLKWSLQGLATATSGQRPLFPDSVVTVDELAFDFDHWAFVVRSNYLQDLSRPQADALAAIDRKLATMSRDGAEFAPDLWTEDALTSSVHWGQVRELAALALEAFAWTIEGPPAPPDPGRPRVSGSWAQES